MIENALNLLDQRLAELCSNASDLLEQLVELRALHERVRDAERAAAEKRYSNCSGSSGTSLNK